MVSAVHLVNLDMEEVVTSLNLMPYTLQYHGIRFILVTTSSYMSPSTKFTAPAMLFHCVCMTLGL